MLGAFIGAFRKTPPFCGRDPASLTASLASDVIARLHDSSTGLRLHLSHFTAAPAATCAARGRSRAMCSRRAASRGRARSRRWRRSWSYGVRAFHPALRALLCACLESNERATCEVQRRLVELVGELARLIALELVEDDRVQRLECEPVDSDLGNRPVLKRQSDNTWHAHGAARYVGDTNHVQLRDAVLVAILGVDQQSFVALVRVVCGDVSHCGPCAACSACVKCPSRFSSVSVSSALRSSTQSGAPSRSKHSAV